MSEKPDIVIRREAGFVVVEFADSRISEGSIVDAIQAALTQLLESDPQQKIVIDFQRVELMSSAMLGVLVRLYRDLAENGGRMVLCGLQPPIQKVFELTRLDQLFRIEKDLAPGFLDLQDEQQKTGQLLHAGSLARVFGRRRPTFACKWRGPPLVGWSG